MKYHFVKYRSVSAVEKSTIKNVTIDIKTHQQTFNSDAFLKKVSPMKIVSSSYCNKPSKGCMY